MDTRPCSVCGGGDDDGTILLCDECNKPYHNGIHCAGFVTECDYGDWACLNCSEQQSDEDEEGASQLGRRGGIRRRRRVTFVDLLFQGVRVLFSVVCRSKVT